MKKLELIEAVNKRLSKKLHPKTLSVYMGRAFNQIIFDTFRKDVSGMDLFTKTYVKVPVQYDKEQELYYSVLPATIVKLPIAGDGIMSISGAKAKHLEFVPITSHDAFMFADLEVGSMLGGLIPFYIMGNRVEYVGENGLDEIENVRMRLVISFDEYGMLDEVYIPSGMDERFFEVVINLTNGAPPEKEINDGSDKTK